MLVSVCSGNLALTGSWDSIFRVIHIADQPGPRPTMRRRIRSHFLTSSPEGGFGQTQFSTYTTPTGKSFLFPATCRAGTPASTHVQFISARAGLHRRHQHEFPRARESLGQFGQAAYSRRRSKLKRPRRSEERLHRSNLIGTGRGCEQTNAAVTTG
jgi:hypothetical protein